MTLANHYLYHADELHRVAGIGVALVAGGLLLWSVSSATAISVVLIFVGCLILTNAEYPARSGTKIVLQQIGDNIPQLNCVLQPV